jgi:hypothetical protein
MKIHFLAPEDKNKWHPLWDECFNTWAQTKHDLNIWTDKGIDQLLKEDNEEFYTEYLNKLDNIYKFDYVRYIILKKYGGAYVDMDVELVNDFFPLLDPNIIYMMEGTNGTYVENSIMISPIQDPNKPYNQKSHYEKASYEIWGRIKSMAKNNIIRRFDEINNNSKLVIEVVGPGMLSTFFSKLKNSLLYDILGYYNFNNPNSTLSFTKHHYSGTWCQITEDVAKQLNKGYGNKNLKYEI